MATKPRAPYVEPSNQPSQPRPTYSPPPSAHSAYDQLDDWDNGGNALATDDIYDSTLD
jgi:hypothetical protein